MTRQQAKEITFDMLGRFRRFRLAVDQHVVDLVTGRITFNPLYTVIERISPSQHRFALGEHGRQVWYANREDAEKWMKQLEAKAT